MISPCPECGGQRVSAPLYGDAAIGRGTWATRHVTDLRCLACLACGYTALYAKDLDKLRNAARKHPKQFGLTEAPAIPAQREPAGETSPPGASSRAASSPGDEDTAEHPVVP